MVELPGEIHFDVGDLPFRIGQGRHAHADPMDLASDLGTTAIGQMSFRMRMAS